MQHTIKLELQIGDFQRQLGHMDPSQVFALLNIIIWILGQGLSEEILKKHSGPTMMPVLPLNAVVSTVASATS